MCETICLCGLVRRFVKGTFMSVVGWLHLVTACCLARLMRVYICVYGLQFISSRTPNHLAMR